jgi:uncharacterized membrane protein YidH (DUF202 family)
MKTETMVLMWTSLALLAGGITSAVLAGQIDCGYDAALECEAMAKRAWQLPAVVIALGVGAGMAALWEWGRPSSPESASTPDAP